MPRIAEARYTGTMTSHSRRGPSGESYRFANPPQSESQWRPIHDVADAHAFEDVGVLELRWKGMGKVVAELDGPATGTEAMLEGMGYKAKRKIAKHLDLEFDGNPKEVELDEALEPEIEGLQEAMNQ